GNYRAALERARSPFVCVLDDDDRYLPGFLPSVLDAFHRDPSLGVVFTGVYVDDGRSLTPRMPDVAPGRHEGFLAELVRRLPIICSATMMRREALLEDGRVLR